MLEKYNSKKIGNQEVFEYINKHLSESGNKRFCECGSWIEFFADWHVEKLKVFNANFCKNRFCPMCAWRMTFKDTLKISVLMKYIEVVHDKAFIFVTLTAPNVKGEDLPKELNKYNLAFKCLCKRPEILGMNHGYIRKLEITYNKERDDYHPHFHCIFAVDKGYFSGGRYVKQERWLNLWRSVMKDESITQVDVRRVKRGDASKVGGEIENKVDKIMNEMAAYAAKDVDYTVSQEVFDMFYKALKGRQVITFSGLFAEANKLYKKDELDEYKSIDDIDYDWIVKFVWGKKQYLEKSREQISKDMYLQLRRMALDETAITS